MAISLNTKDCEGRSRYTQHHVTLGETQLYDLQSCLSNQT